MTRLLRGATLWLALLLSLFAFTPASLLAGPKWEPIPPEDLAVTSCPYYPGAKAENLFVRVEMDTNGLHFHKRVKLYSDDKADILGALALRYGKDLPLLNIYSRVIKPDGSTTEYTEADFIKSEDTVNGVDTEKRTAAFSNVGKGDIVEIKYTQSLDKFWWGVFREFCQDNVPTRKYSFDAISSENDYAINYFALKNFTRVSGKWGRQGFVITEIPPFESEPAMPPMHDIRGWFVIIFESKYRNRSDDYFWDIHSREAADHAERLSKPSSRVKEKTGELLAGVTDEREKLRRLNEFCRNSIKNINMVETPETAALKKKIYESHDWDATDTLKAGGGFGSDIDNLFAAMARAAGFEVRLVLSGSRHTSFRLDLNDDWIFYPSKLIAVKVGGAWENYAPGDYFVPAGMIYEAGQLAQFIRCEKRNSEKGVLPAAKATDTPVLKKGRFTLSDDGTLTGEVEISLGGYAGIRIKSDWYKHTAEEFITQLRKDLAKRLPTAEIESPTWSKLDSAELPQLFKYKVRVPGYAESLGQRLAFAPNYFQHGAEPLFSAATRIHPIIFDHAFQETDDIEIVLPEGYTLDEPTAPVPVNDEYKIMTAGYTMSYKGKSRTLSYKRVYTLGGNGIISYRVEVYPLLKGLSDRMKRSDEHVLLCKPKTTPQQAPAPTTTTSPVPQATEAPASHPNT